MYKVLIADDESIIRKGLSQLLDWESLGFTVVGFAANGREALSFIQKNKPDVVLIDIRMPNLSGLDAIKQAREEGFLGKVIILTGYADFSYAQEAIKHNVTAYITKPVDEEELEHVLTDIKASLDAEHTFDSTNALFAKKAHEAMLEEFLLNRHRATEEIIYSLKLHHDRYRVIIYDKYSHEVAKISYNLPDLLSSAGKKEVTFEHIKIGSNNVILLEGSKSVEYFDMLISKYENELPPEKDSPLDTIFISCGRTVNSPFDISLSYGDALGLIQKRFFCDQYQHIVKYDESKTKKSNVKPPTAPEIMEKYSSMLVNHIQTYRRNKIAETLHELQNALYNSGFSADEQKNLMVDMYLNIKEKIFFLYKASNIPFMANSEVINTIKQSDYLYEIIAFLSNQFEMVISSIGYSSRESIIDDIVYYIDHNYSENITLENIAPLFGYNSSYLGKIFSKKMNINFNSYLDSVRIEHSKQLLLTNTIQVYKVAELVGYRNVDYFHIKFKKNTGMSPAEFRKKNQAKE